MRTVRAEELCLQVNTAKSCTTLFSLSPKQTTGTFKISYTPPPLVQAEEETYLIKSHLANAKTKARENIQFYACLQAHEKILKSAYLGTIRSVLAFGSNAWMTSA